MYVHEQLSRARHEEPLRTTVRDRRVWASHRRSPEVSAASGEIIFSAQLAARRLACFTVAAAPSPIFP